MTDDGRHYPLGAPIRPGPTEPADGRWEPVRSDNPYVQRNTVTGKFRNVRPSPPAAPSPGVPYYFGVILDDTQC